MELQGFSRAEDGMREWPLLVEERRNYTNCDRFRSLAGEAEARSISYWPSGSINALFFHIIF
jgi:hypothetical protein